MKRIEGRFQRLRIARDKYRVAFRLATTKSPKTAPRPVVLFPRFQRGTGFFHIRYRTRPSRGGRYSGSRERLIALSNHFSYSSLHNQSEFLADQLN